MGALVCLLITLLLTVFGFFQQSRRAPMRCWLLFTVSIPAACIAMKSDAPLMRMALIIPVLFAGMKAIAIGSTKNATPHLVLGPIKWLLFCWGWPGMLSSSFYSLGGKTQPGGGTRMMNGGARVALGIGLLFLSTSNFQVGNAQLPAFLNPALLLVGLSMFFHFGLLRVISGFWRLWGANTSLLFKQPARSTSLSEFWGRRWNLAFIEMSALAVVRPLRQRFGGSVSLMAAFVFSGLLHELAISLPVNSGYGGPMVYFIIQGTAVLIEQKHPFLVGNCFWARLWTFVVLAVPLPLLFHNQFILQIAYPLANGVLESIQLAGAVRQ